ncbi:MAG: TonB-dependent receptor [Bacteroidales bacterium]|nr:TonB-dependent receptor [Bacteroidales bacterium]
MPKYFLLLWFSGLSSIALSQVSDSTGTLFDTIILNEVKVSAVFPLNNNDVVDFYRPDYFSTLDKVNARLDGMSLIKRGAYALEPQLNGFSAGQLNVTIDGMKMFGACTDKMDPVTSYIEPTNLKNITINTGTNGSQNGCNIGGSMDMSLQEPNSDSPRPFYSSLGYGYESVSRGSNILFTAGYTKRKLAWGIDGVYRKNHNYMDGTHSTIPFSQFEKTNIHSVFIYSPNTISRLKADILFDGANNVGYPALPMDVAIARATLFALEYRRTGRTQLISKMYFNTIHHVMDDSKRDSLYFLENETEIKNDSVYMRMDMPGKSSTLGAYMQLIVPWNDHNKLTIKADNYTNNSVAEMTMHMRYAGFSPEPPMYMQTWPEMLRNVSGLFVQNTTSISKKLKLTVNGRIDYNIDILQSEYGQLQFSVFNYTLEKKQSRVVKSMNMSAQYRINHSLSLTTTAGYSDRMPAIGERLGFYLYNAYDGYDYIGNPYIKTEKSNFFSIGFMLSKPKIKINLSQSFSYIRDYIMGISDTLIPAMNFYARGTRVYTNVPAAGTYSADLQLLYNPLKSISLFLLSKFTMGRINGGNNMPLIPPLKNIAVVQYKKDRFSFQAENESSLAQNFINPDYGEHKTPAYTVFNIKSAYSFSVSRSILDISFGITNIFNGAYYEHLDWGRINRPGRSFEMFVKYSY